MSVEPTTEQVLAALMAFEEAASAYPEPLTNAARVVAMKAALRAALNLQETQPCATPNNPATK